VAGNRPKPGFFCFPLKAEELNLFHSKTGVLVTVLGTTTIRLQGLIQDAQNDNDIVRTCYREDSSWQQVL
jgi:hypothetical protein